MKTVEFTLPTDLAHQLELAGELTPERIEHFLRLGIRTEGFARFTALRAKLDADPIPPMSEEELNAEIAAARAERRLATHS